MCVCVCVCWTQTKSFHNIPPPRCTCVTTTHWNNYNSMLYIRQRPCQYLSRPLFISSRGVESRSPFFKPYIHVLETKRRRRFSATTGKRSGSRFPSPWTQHTLVYVISMRKKNIIIKLGNSQRHVCIIKFDRATGVGGGTRSSVFLQLLIFGKIMLILAGIIKPKSPFWTGLHLRVNARGYRGVCVCVCVSGKWARGLPRWTMTS